MRGKRTARAALAAVLLAACLPAGAEEGMVRVRMTRYETDGALTFRVHGAYLADGVLLGDGAVVTASAQGGRVVLRAGGMALDAGERITLRRAASEDPAFLTFYEGENVFAGDLTLAESGGLTVPVLSLPLEDYVAGVVPYEMGDAFPAEALKAQAVAARTYALAMRGAYADYDLVDNTNDQVYRGVPSDSPVSLGAVRDTAGIVGLVGGAPAICYYTASNGGQTERGEVAWPSRKNRRYDYMQQKDDPYDLVNERSPVRRCTLPRVPAADGSDAAAQAVAASLARASLPGIPDDPELIRVDEILSVGVAYPETDRATRVPSGLRFEARVSLRGRVELRVREEHAGEEAAPVGSAFTDFVPKEGTVSWTAPYFGTLERALGLSINAADNEIVTVLETGDAFLLEARRYGHGVGMSQRGAEEMARRGMKMEEIFAFYYPGITLTARQETPAATPTVPAVLAVTPRPSASPTPRPTLMPVTLPLPEGAELYHVDGIAEDSSLNLRAGPALSAEIVRRLYYGQQLAVLDVDAAGWAHVRTDAAEGYVRSEYLVKD